MRPKKIVKTDHHHQRLEDGPGRPQHRLLVADLHVAPGQEIDQLAELPELPDVDPLPARGRAR